MANIKATPRSGSLRMWSGEADNDTTIRVCPVSEGFTS